MSQYGNHTADRYAEPASGVPVAHPLLAQCAVDPASNLVAEPDGGADEQKQKHKLKRDDHESSSRDFLLAAKS